MKRASKNKSVARLNWDYFSNRQLLSPLQQEFFIFFHFNKTRYYKNRNKLDIIFGNHSLKPVFLKAHQIKSFFPFLSNTNLFFCRFNPFIQSVKILKLFAEFEGQGFHVLAIRGNGFFISFLEFNALVRFNFNLANIYFSFLTLYLRFLFTAYIHYFLFFKIYFQIFTLSKGFVENKCQSNFTC